MTIKANEMKNGDKFISTHYSSMWCCMREMTCTVINVTETNGHYDIWAKAKDGCKEFMVNVFASAETEYKVA